MYVPHRPEKGCWEWTGYKDLRGYGRVSWHNRPRFAHRVIFQELRSEELTPDQFLCHHCDNPSCVNPDHLFVGTSADNLRDMRLKGRSARGEKHRAAKLTERDVIEARWRYRNTRVTGSQLVAEYGITPTPMSQMLRGVTWTYLPVYPTSPDWNGGAEYGRTA